jgi:hypothetical protein
MTVGTVHHARLAWDAARVIVAVADRDQDDLYEWLSARLDLVCGPEFPHALSASRTRLLYRSREDIVAAEAGTWRARVQDLLDRRPALVGPLHALVAELAPAARPGY